MLPSQEESYWKQRAKVFWLEEGDSNTRFFHATATTRKKMNHIKSLRNDAGEHFSNQVYMCTIIKDYYFDVFTGGNQVVMPQTSSGSRIITDE